MPLKPTPLRAVIFDAYGTLFTETHMVSLDVYQRMVDTLHLPLAVEAFRDGWRTHDRAFRRRRVVLTPEGAYADTFQPYRHAWTDHVRKILETHHASGDPTLAAEVMAQTMASQTLYPETKQVVDALTGKVGIAILSNADPDYFATALRNSGLKVDAVVLSGNEQVYKPHPRIYQRALDLLHCQPQEALFVGNSPEEDVRGAALVGIPTVWVNRYGAPWPLPDVTPTYQLPDLLGLSDIVRERAVID